MAFFRLIPNLTIMAPKDFKELEDMMEFAVNVGKPVVIRYPRGGEGKEKFNQHKKSRKSSSIITNVRKRRYCFRSYKYQIFKAI